MSEIRVPLEQLRDFVSRVFEEMGLSQQDASIVADVLVAADMRGIPSHGVARIKRYIDGIRSGMMVPDARPDIVFETPLSARIDGRSGLGQPVSHRAMEIAIEKAKANGIGMVAVFNSNHFGIAGYYAMMALEHDLIGLATTNTYPLVVPTFGREPVLGTNPIAFAAPTGRNRPFVLDMATSVVTRGKIEVYHRLELPLPEQWATDEEGKPCSDPGRVLENFRRRLPGGLLPLGGASEVTGGHKGYGLAMLVEILSAVLTGAKISALSYTGPGGSEIGHFFAAINPELFMPIDEFKDRMDELIDSVKNSRKAEGRDRIFIHGEKEFEKAEESISLGVPLDHPTFELLKAVGAELGVSAEFLEQNR